MIQAPPGQLHLKVSCCAVSKIQSGSVKIAYQRFGIKQQQDRKQYIVQYTFLYTLYCTLHSAVLQYHTVQSIGLHIVPALQHKYKNRIPFWSNIQIEAEAASAGLGQWSSQGSSASSQAHPGLFTGIHLRRVQKTLTFASNHARTYASMDFGDHHYW